MTDISDNQGGVLVSKALADEWVSTPLAELGEIITGTTPSTKNRNYYGNKYPFITPADIEEAKYVRTAQKWLSADGLEVSRSLPRDTVLFTCIGTIGKMGMTSEELSATNQQINAVICAPTVDPHFLYYSLLFHARDIKQLAAKTTLPIVNKGNFARFCIPLPPPLQQRRIARVLATIQRAIEAQEKVIAAARELKRSLMRHLFTYGPVPITETVRVPLKETEIGSMPERWEVVSLGGFARIGNGSTPKRTNPLYWEGGKIPWLTSAKVHETIIQQADEFVTEIARKECHLPRVKGGSIVVAITGQGKTLGNAAIVTFDTCVSQHLAYISLQDSRFVPDFVLAFLQHQYRDLRRLSQGGGTTKSALTCALLKHYRLPMPPAEDQQLIAQGLRAVAEKIEAEEKRKAALQALFKTMLHHLMTGKIRVKDL